MDESSLLFPILWSCREFSGSKTNFSLPKQRTLWTCSTILLHPSLHGTSLLLWIFTSSTKLFFLRIAFFLQCLRAPSLDDSEYIRESWTSLQKGIYDVPTWYHLKDQNFLLDHKYSSTRDSPVLGPYPTSRLPESDPATSVPDEFLEWDMIQKLSAHMKLHIWCSIALPSTKGLFGIGSARWPDGPPQSGIAQGLNLIPISGVGEAASGVGEAAGDEKIGGNGVEGTFNKDMTNDEMTFEAHKQIVKPWAKRVITSRWGVVCTLPSRSWQLPLSGRETARKKKKPEKWARLQMESGFRSTWKQLRLVRSDVPAYGEEELVRGVHIFVAGVVQVYHRLHVVEEEEKGRKVVQEVEREDQGEETAHTWMVMEMIWKTQTWAKVHVCVKMKTRQPTWKNAHDASVDVVAGVRIVKCHASIDVVIDVRIVECHASINVVIGIRVVLCHPLVDFPLFRIFTSCPNSHFVVMLWKFIITFTCSYFAHVLHRGNTSYEVWCLHHPSVTVDRRQL